MDPIVPIICLYINIYIYTYLVIFILVRYSSWKNLHQWLCGLQSGLYPKSREPEPEFGFLPSSALRLLLMIYIRYVKVAASDSLWLHGAAAFQGSTDLL